jgi:hypothetical protein
MGITKGVFSQERERRMFYDELMRKGRQIGCALYPSLKENTVVIHPNMSKCANCLIFTDSREIKKYTSNGYGPSDVHKRRIVVRSSFIISRGWRNFINEPDFPPFEQIKFSLY